MSALSQCYSNIIYQGISAPGHGKEMVGGINVIYKHCIYQLMPNIQLLESKIFDSQILMHSFTEKNDVNLAKKFKNIYLKRILNM